jgi:hypothetical protein
MATGSNCPQQIPGQQLLMTTQNALRQFKPQKYLFAKLRILAESFHRTDNYVRTAGLAKSNTSVPHQSFPYWHEGAALG